MTESPLTNANVTIITCPLHNGSSNSTTSPNGNDNSSKNSHRNYQKSQQNGHNGKRSNFDDDSDGDGDDEKNIEINSLEELTRQQLIAIIKQQEQIIQQQHYKYQQQQTVINALTNSHQALIQNCDDTGKSMISLSIQAMQDVNQLRQENQRLMDENSKLKALYEQNQQQTNAPSETA